MTEATIKVVLKTRPSLPGEVVLEDDSFKLYEEEGKIFLKNSTFTFDKVYTASSKNKQIYDELVCPRIKNLLEGYNVTILAYGTTGSGKTHTMGLMPKNENEIGLIPLSLTDLFQHVEASSTTIDVNLKASFFEIYMEDIKDLLNPNASYVSGDSKEARLANMKQVEIKNLNEAIQVLEDGSHGRTTASTSKNSRSSRSHAFYIISITITDKVSGQSKFSKFQLVDLAGSERAVNDAKAKEFKQGVHINKGLSALGRVIVSIYENKSHIPYRDSILTRHLQDSFGGNSLTVMITCISPGKLNIEETLSSLRYANFVKCIKNRPIINSARQGKSIEELQDQLRKYKKIFGSYKDAANYENMLSKYKENLNMLQPRFDTIKAIIQEMLQEIKLMSSQNIISPEKLEDLHRIMDEMSNLMIVEELSATTTPDTSTTASNLSLNQINQVFQTITDIPLPSVIDKGQNSFEDFQYEDKDLDRVIRLMEIHLDSLKNLRNLYEFTQCEEEKGLLIQKIQKKRGELDILIHQEKSLEEKEESCEELQNKIRCLEEKLLRLESEVERQQKAAERKEEIAHSHEKLEKKLHELRQLQAQQHEEISSLEKENAKQRSNADALKQILVEKEVTEFEEKVKLQKKINELEAKLQNLPITTSCDKMSQVSPKTEFTHKAIFASIEESAKVYVQLQMVEFEAQCIEEKVSNVTELEDKEGNTTEESLSDKESTSSKHMLLNNVNNVKTIVNDHKRAVSFNFNSITEQETKPIIEFMYKKYVTAETSCQKARTELEEAKNKIISLKKEKEELQASCERKVVQLNMDWETKTLLMIESNRPLSATGELRRQKSPLIKEVEEAIKKGEENVLKKKCEELAEKTKEVEKLKKLLEEKTMMSSQISLPTLAKKIKPKPPTRKRDSDMVTEFLTDPEESFNAAEDSRLLDPDFRGTPLYKREKPRIKRKASEGGIECPRPTRMKRLRTSFRKKLGCLNPKVNSPASGCSCNTNCGSMRCSCRKKKGECTPFCGCNKSTCQNFSSSSKQ